MGGLELQANWDKIKRHNQYHKLFGKGEDRKSIAAHNIHRDLYNQYGGTAMSVFGSMARDTTSGKDATGLGRWSWMAIDSGYRKTIFITAYRPVNKRSSSKRRKTTEGVTIWEQHRRYFWEVEGLEDPRPIELFDNHLFTLIKECRLNGEEVVLMIDANEDVYKGKLSDTIAKPGIELESAYDQVHEKQIPSSHSKGSKALMGIFASPGINCAKAFIGHHYLGVGDHRGLHVVSLTRESVLGTTDPSPATRTGRNIQAKIPRIRKPYNSTLQQHCERHNMLPKLTTLLKCWDKIVDTDNCSPEKADLKSQIDRWDEEHVQFAKSAEKDCRKKKVCRIP